jgi:integrase
VKGTRADAEQALLRLRLELFDGTSSNPRDTTVAELLAAWLNWASPRLSPSTRREYDRIVRVHLVPSLGRLPIRRLRPVDIDRMMDDLRKGGLAPRSIRGIHAVLRRALNQAVKWEWIERNPVALASPPAVWSPEIRPPSLLAVMELIAAVRQHNDDIADFFHVAAMTGMRRGEIAGLRWDDIDVERRALTVRHSVVHAGPGEVVVKAP